MHVRKEIDKSAWYLFRVLLFALFALVLTSASTMATQAMTGLKAPEITSNRSAAIATSTPACGLTWRGVDSSQPPGVSELDGVAGTSASDVWAVGFTASNGITQTLTMHWDGAVWSIVPSPNGSGANSWLWAVAAYTANDVWAVGTTGTASASQTLIEHWDGAQWSIVPSPNVSPTGVNTLRGVAIAGDGDVWTVGYDGATPAYRSLTEHWDGSTWSMIPSPNDGTGDNLLHAVTATGTSDVWAAGTHFQTNINFYRTTNIHWDGSVWTLYTDPPTYGNNYFFGAYAVSQNDVWAVGGQEDMVAHWDGTAWHNAGPVVIGDLHGLSGSAHDDVWAVGYITETGYSSIFHYDGSLWWPFPSNSGAHLQGVTAISRSNAWAVGFDDFGHVLIEHYDDPCATPTNTPTPSVTTTGTPPTDTRTRTPSATRTQPTLSPTITQPVPTSTPVCSPAWQLVNSPSTGQLLGVSVVAADDIWAVGSGPVASQTFVEHWDGDTWAIIPSPNPPHNINKLYSVVALASNDIWAVGFSEDVFPPGEWTLVEHWDGSAWSVVPSPNPGPSSSMLYGVAAVASNDIWAVGYYTPIGNSALSTLVEHWDGNQWSVIPSPNPSTFLNQLFGVTALSADDVWAVGNYYNDGAGGYPALIEHWDGSAWSVVSNPGANSWLYQLAAISASEVWAVGIYQTGPSAYNTLVEHWDGSQWSVVPSPSPYLGGDNRLMAVAAISEDNIWAVGWAKGAEVGGAIETLVEHWDGNMWEIVASPSVGTNYNFMQSLGVVDSSDIWAVGYYANTDGANHALVEHFTGAGLCATATSVPTAVDTNTPSMTPTQSHTSTPTATPTNTLANTAVATNTTTGTPPPPATRTASPTLTSTACPIQFTDVPNPSTFYDYIRCLACRGIVNGYSDGTFRPNNSVTRGQLSKIVSNSAGFSEAHTTQMFEDQPVGSTFYTYTARLASRGFVSGYPCGDVGEPCMPPDNLPYFRTSNNATRGQITKIVSEAANFQDPPAGQTFEDVPPGSAFYTYTERLASRGIMQGYPCGHPEPCAPPSNRPYFRPGNNVTRGQAAKITANAFYPNCQSPYQR